MLRLFQGDAKMNAMQDAQVDTQLKLSKMKWVATGMLALAALLYVAGKMQGWDYLSAFSEAAMIGALADWFAVVALFRHPMGLPIPHTAIVPKNKQSIANGLADFVVQQFLSAEAISEKFGNFDAAAHLAEWLPKNRKRVAGYLSIAMEHGVRALDDRRMHDFIAEAARKRLQEVDLSGFIAGGLELLTCDKRHRKILHGGLHRFADYLEDPENEERITAFIKGWSENAFVQSMIGPFVPAIRTAVASRLRAASEDQDNRLYAEFDALVENYISRLQDDSSLRERLSAKKEALLHHPEFARQVESLWNQFRDWVVLDLSHPDSAISGRMVKVVIELEDRLAENEEFRSWINGQIQESLIRIANANKGQLGDLIREQLARWDDRYMVDKLELYLGRDLQYIRINGTLVGGLFGLLIYAATKLIAGN
jgi:uncharacterized membrane-anchored protein YjiN (DUF445 family)